MCVSGNTTSKEPRYAVIPTAGIRRLCLWCEATHTQRQGIHTPVHPILSTTVAMQYNTQLHSLRRGPDLASMW